ncbi:MAG TPA: outer membrane protein assembly factor BamE [Burkholderiales bacterium]|nr:outer membrane protein assembly factor BamE [Burkholderiales bacterium]
MKVAAVAALSAALLVAACSRVTQENFARIQDGMSEQEVSAILGSPAQSSSGSVLGISGTSSTWRDGDTVITIRFVNGKVAMRSFDKPGAKP